MAVKNVDVELDFAQLDKQIAVAEENSLLDPSAQRVGVRTTLFAIGKDPRISTDAAVSSPDLRLVEILKDGLMNPFIEVNWRIARSDVDRAGVQGFNIFRRKVSRKQYLNERRRGDESTLFFSRNAFTRLGIGQTRQGKFSPEGASLNLVSRPLLMPTDVNASLSEFTNVAQARYNSSLNVPSVSTHSGFTNPLDGVQPVFNNPSFTKFFDERRFKRLGYVTYDSFLAQEQKKFVSVTEREFVDLKFKDKCVLLGEVYEYYVTSVPKDIRESVQSNSVKVFLEDRTPIRPPQQILAKFSGTNRVRVSVTADKRDNVNRVLVYRREEAGEFAFEKIASIINISDCVNFVDNTIMYGRTYIYRIFMENIHKVLSEPKEISVDAFVQRVLPSTRSNNLKIPILSAVQDQNSNSIRITIAANDPLISYYRLDRRNRTIHEKIFSVPGRESGYGGDGWETNIFFVNRERSLLDGSVSRSTDVLNRRTIESEIKFLDDTVQVNHIYQYRIRGVDLFGNTSSHALTIVKATGKPPVRTPINLRLEILRGHPYRAKLSWNDDNESTRFTKEQLLSVESRLDPDDVTVLYKIQRRKLGERQYEEFPLNANEFLVDEVASRDTVPIVQRSVPDTFRTLPNISVQSQTTTLAPPVVSTAALIGVPQRGGIVASTLAGNVSIDEGRGSGIRGLTASRPFGQPQYLNPNETYFYRVSAQKDGEESNFSDEFRIRTISHLSDPLEFKAEVLDLRVSPLVGRLTWTSSDTETRPDHWIIERKIDVITDTFTCIGKAYLEEILFDKNLRLGTSYIYRIKSVDNLGRESDFFEARLTL